MKTNFEAVSGDTQAGPALLLARNLLVGARPERVGGRALDDLQVLASMAGAKAVAIELSPEKGEAAKVIDVHLVMTGDAVQNAIAADGLVLGVDASRACAVRYLAWYSSEAAGRGVPFEMAEAVNSALGIFEARAVLGMSLTEFLGAWLELARKDLDGRNPAAAGLMDTDTGRLRAAQLAAADVANEITSFRKGLRHVRHHA